VGSLEAVAFGEKSRIMTDVSPYGFLLSRRSKDKSFVSAVVKRLLEDGLRVWFNEWEIKPGDTIPAKIDEGLEHSSVLVLCMSVHAFGSDRVQLQADTFRFCDPLNRERRWIP
jgi:hypothetical protein